MIKRNGKGFTIVELAICISLIAIVSAFLLPNIVNSYKKTKQDIINISNDETITVVMRGEEIIEQGKDLDLSKYTIIDVQYKNNQVIVYVQ